MPASNAFPKIDFSPIGNLVDVYNQGRIAAARRAMLDPASGGNIDYNAAARKLISAGDLEGGLALARIGEAAGYRSEDRAWRQQEANRAQSNADRAFGLQERQFEEKPAIAWQEDESGRKVPYAVDPRKGTIAPIPVPGVTDTAQAIGNPFSTGKMNEAQSKDALYASRMMNAESVLREPKVVEAGKSPTQNAMSRGPLGIGNYLVSDDFQRFDQAQRDFINATLRRESGAVISESEFDNARKQYFPQPGDSQPKLKQKQANREEAIRGIAGAAGPSYRPPYTFDQSGELVKTPGLRPGTVGSSGQMPQPAQPIAPTTAPGSSSGAARAAPTPFTKQQVIDEARAAIGRGKDPAAVAKRLQEMGIDPAEVR